MKIDNDLLKRLKCGDDKAFETIFWQYNSHIYHFVYSLLYDNELAEDITQTVFLKIWENREGIDLEQGINAYLFTIARHMVYKETEHQVISNQYIEKVLVTSSEEDSLLEKQLEADSLKEHILKLLDNLPPSRLEIFKLSRFQHLSNKEIAAKLSISERTVETQIYRSLQYLKEKLTSEHLIALFIILLAQK